MDMACDSISTLFLILGIFTYLHKKRIFSKQNEATAAHSKQSWEFMETKLTGSPLLCFLPAVILSNDLIDKLFACLVIIAVE